MFDDCISGAYSIDVVLQNQKILLKQYELIIRKWSSNSLEALVGIDSDMRETLIELTFEKEDSYCSLKNVVATKRTTLSLIARLYDPVGWIGPSSYYQGRLLNIKDLSSLSNHEISHWVKFIDDSSPLMLYAQVESYMLFSV